jgi:hypothetical protein
MGSPYAHPMLPNFPREDGVWSLRFSNDVYERLLGFKPKSFWNPECGWREYVPEQAIAAGYSNMIGDFEAYSRSCGPDAKPLRPEIYACEFSREPAFYNFGFKYDLPGTERAIHFPFSNILGIPSGQLRLFLRTDRIAQFGVRYFMGMDGYTLDRYLELIDKYSRQSAGEPEGALIVFADDAEYIGTNAWFRLKYQNKPDNVFEATPESRQKLIDLVSALRRRGTLTTFDQACNELPPLEETITFDDDSAWHGARSSTWAHTPMAQLLRPWQDLVRAKLNDPRSPMTQENKKLAWFHLTNSYNSDGQWPPTLANAPHIVHPFNYAYCFENLLTAEMLVGGVDHDKMETYPAETLTSILGPQQGMVQAKSERIIASGEVDEKVRARQALLLVEKSQDVSALAKSRVRILYPSEYRVRADALVQARRLVGGVLIEKLQP